MEAVTVLFWIWCWMMAGFAGFVAYWLLNGIFSRRQFIPRLWFGDSPEGKPARWRR